MKGWHIRHARNEDCCKGLTDEQVDRIVAKKYADFCKYRWELASKMPDYRTNIFSTRIFNGSSFDVE